MAQHTIRDILLSPGLSLTPSEERIVQLLLADYPTLGLGTATNLAKKAGVSDATVVRLAVKLGFEGFPDLQRKLLAEVEARLHSPLLMMETKRPTGGEAMIAESYLHAVSEAIDRTVSATPGATYERAARLVLETKGKVALLGGRFSRHLAGMLSGYLIQMRPGVLDLGAISAQSFDMLLDLGKKDLLIVFDYRRYQADVVSFSQQAAAQGVSIILFTDLWLSPIADQAELTIICPLEVPSPYDTMAPAMAQVEALATQILASIDETTRKRIERVEKIRHDNGVTLDTEQTGTRPATRDFPGPKSTKQG